MKKSLKLICAVTVVLFMTVSLFGQGDGARAYMYDSDNPSHKTVLEYQCETVGAWVWIPVGIISIPYYASSTTCEWVCIQNCPPGW